MKLVEKGGDGVESCNHMKSSTFPWPKAKGTLAMVHSTAACNDLDHHSRTQPAASGKRKGGPGESGNGGLSKKIK